MLDNDDNGVNRFENSYVPVAIHILNRTQKRGTTEAVQYSRNLIFIRGCAYRLIGNWNNTIKFI